MYKLIDGNEISDSIIEELKKNINVLNAAGKDIIIADIIVGNDPSSNIYVKRKMQKFCDVGINFNLISLPEDTSEITLINKIEELNNHDDVNAIFIELPLPKHIDELNVINKIKPSKDVEGFGDKCFGALFKGDKTFVPCTAEGIVELLKRSNIEISSKNVVVLGRSNIVGKPVAMLLLKENATVTICHSKTYNLKSICKNADILVAAIGKANFIDDTYIKEGAVVIDAGINRIQIDGKFKTCGDVDFDKVAQHTSYITPVPGGVGPMTVTMLIKHCVETLTYE